MTMIYSNPVREQDAATTGAQPDVEVFYHDCTGSTVPCPFESDEQLAEFECGARGWNWRLRNVRGEFSGPFDTEAEAITGARAACPPDEDCGPECECECATCTSKRTTEWSGAKCREHPDCWIDDVTGEHVNAFTSVRTPVELPPCVLAMGCYCAGHARGNPAIAPCDTNEHAEVQS